MINWKDLEERGHGLIEVLSWTAGDEKDQTKPVKKPMT
jgi:hypothetical protein